jgi:hypothetical protein
MANTSVRVQGEPFIMVDSEALGGPPGSFYNDVENVASLNTAIGSLEIEGFRMQLVSDPDLAGSLAISITTNSSAGDPAIELQGYRIRIHLTGNNDPVTGQPLYAFCVVADNSILVGTPIGYVENDGLHFGLADMSGDGKMFLIFDHTGTIAPTDQISEWLGFKIDVGIPITVAAPVPPIAGDIPVLFDAMYNLLSVLIHSGLGGEG